MPSRAALFHLNYGHGSAMRRVAHALFLGLFVAILFGSPPSQAQNTLRAAAVVNDEVVSMLDLSMRTRLALLSAGLEVTRENFERLQPQVLRTLVDERLQMQEANRLNLSVDDQEVQRAFGQLAAQNRMEPGTFVDFLNRNSVLPTILFDQIRSGLTWNLLLNRRLRPEVDISDDEVDQQVARLQAASGNPQHRVYEIFLAVDNVLQEEEALETAQRLITELRGGAKFTAVARQVSQAPTASVGGDLGWIDASQLPPEVANVVQTMQPGQLSAPIATIGGVYIVAVRDRRERVTGEPTVDLRQVLFGVPAGASAQAVQQATAQAEQTRQQIRSCDDAERLAVEMGVPGKGDLGSVQLSELPAELRQVVSGLEIGQASPPLRLSGGVGLLVVCSRDDGTINRNQVYESLVDQRLSMLARRYLRDLRRQANVDIRL